MDEDDWQAPVGVVTVEVMEARLPQRLTLTKKEKPLNPYAAVVVGHSSTPVRYSQDAPHPLQLMHHSSVNWDQRIS